MLIPTKETIPGLIITYKTSASVSSSALSHRHSFTAFIHRCSQTAFYLPSSPYFFQYSRVNAQNCDKSTFLLLPRLPACYHRRVVGYVMSCNVKLCKDIAALCMSPSSLSKSLTLKYYTQLGFVLFTLQC